MSELTFPPLPSDPSDVKSDAAKAKYNAELGAVTEVLKTDLTEHVESLKAGIAADAEELKANLTEAARAAAVWDARADTAQKVVDARVDADRAAEVALVQSVHDAYLEVTKQSLDRSLKRSEVVTTTVGAISGTYTALLALVFSVATKQPLESRALVPVLFLGCALLLASIYAAFLRRQTISRRLLLSGVGGMVAEERLRTFLDWTFAGVLQRAWALRASLVALGLGIALLPLPFVDVSNQTGAIMGTAAAVLLGFWLIGEYVFATKVAVDEQVPIPPTLT